MLSSVSRLLFVTLTHSFVASMNSTALSLFDYFSTMMQVALDVPKNRLLGSCITQSTKMLSIRY